MLSHPLSLTLSFSLEETYCVLLTKILNLSLVDHSVRIEVRPSSHTDERTHAKSPTRHRDGPNYVIIFSIFVSAAIRSTEFIDDHRKYWRMKIFFFRELFTQKQISSSPMEKKGKLLH